MLTIHIGLDNLSHTTSCLHHDTQPSLLFYLKSGMLQETAAKTSMNKYTVLFLKNIQKVQMKITESPKSFGGSKPSICDEFVTLSVAEEQNAQCGDDAFKHFMQSQLFETC